MSSMTERPKFRTALCCECGTLRTVSARAAMRNGTYWGNSPEEIAEHLKRNDSYRRFWARVQPWERKLEDLKCETCGQVTRHADVPAPGFIDEAERQNGTPILEGDDAWPIIDAAIEQLEAFDVRVEWDADSRENVYGWIYRYLDDGVYLLGLNDKIPASAVRGVIDWAWRVLLEDPNTNKWSVKPQDGDNPAHAWRCWVNHPRA